MPPRPAFLPPARLLPVLVALLAALAVRAEEPGPGECDILFSEIHYHPPGDKGKEEFIEVHNAGVHWVDLGGWRLASGVEFTFPGGTVLAPGGYLAVARDAAALRQTRKAASVIGDFKGRLQNQGDILRLETRAGRVVATMHYHDGFEPGMELWPRGADGAGSSLELISPHPDWYRPWHWAASRAPGGTPGAPNSVARASRGKEAGEARAGDPGGLRINEARLTGAGAFVELACGGARAAVPLDGLRLTTDPQGAGGAPLSGSAARGKFFLLQGEALGALAAGGGGILLLVRGEPPELIDSLPLRRTSEGGSTGRFPDTTGEAMALPAATPGKENAGPAAPDIVINEVHYHSVADSPAEEFIELHNRGRTAVSLKGWKLRRAATFDFPDDASIAAGGFVVVVGDPKTLQPRVPPADWKSIFGPLKGKLSNSGESILLLDEWENIADLVPYSDEAPWPRGADGEGFSMELVNPELDNRWGAAWTAGGPEGSPCRKNARAVKTMAPAIVGARHEPLVPEPDDAVTVHAHVLATASVASVVVIYRDTGAAGPPVKKTMLDNGKMGDGAARDGHYAVRLPRFRAGALVAFGFVAKDASGRVARLPAEGRDFYFQVEAGGSGALAGRRLPTYRILMPPESWESFAKSRRGDEWFPCTFIGTIQGAGEGAAGGEVRGAASYQAAIRYRGNNSRRPENNPYEPEGRLSYRLRLEEGGRFDGRKRFILNAYSSFRQKAAWDVFRACGLPSSSAAAIRLKTPGLDDHRYVDVEVVNNDFLDDKFASSTGDLFRGRRGAPFGADFSYHGTAPEPYLEVYRRVNREGKRDIAALLKLLEALATRDDDAYARAVAEAADPYEWALYFAANNVLANEEGGLSFDAPDDFFLAQRPADGKFVIIPWDNDSMFLEKNLAQPLFVPRLPAIRRFLRHPAFAPLYHRAVREVLEGPLAPATFSRWLQHQKGIFIEADLAKLESFARRRQRFLRAGRQPAGACGFLAEAGGAGGAGFGSRLFLPGGAAEAALAGFVDPASAFAVRIGGKAAAYDAVTGRWTARLSGDVLAAAGDSQLWIELLGRGGKTTAMHSLSIGRVPKLERVTGTIHDKVEWRQARGPYQLEGVVKVMAGASLRIGPGTEVVCAPDSLLQVEGTLQVDGTAAEPVTFRPAEGSRLWQGIWFTGGSASRALTLKGCRFEGGRDATEAAEAGKGAAGGRGGGFLRVDRMHVVLDGCLVRGIAGVALGAEAATVELRRTRISDCREGIVVRGGKLVAGGCELVRIGGDAIRAVGLAGEGSTVSGCVLRQAGGAGLLVEGGALRVENNLIHQCAVGMAAIGGGRITASHLTLAENAIAIGADRLLLHEGAPAGAPGPAGRSRVELSASVLWPNIEASSTAPGSRLELAACILSPWEPATTFPQGKDLIAARPEFVAARLGDFRLGEGSAGRGAAAGGGDLGFEPRASPAAAGGGK